MLRGGGRGEVEKGAGRRGIHDKRVHWVRVHYRQLGKAVHKPFIFKQR